MKQLINFVVRCGRRAARTIRTLTSDLRERSQKYRRDVNTHLIRGVSYGVGSGAVSLLVIWIQSRY